MGLPYNAETFARGTGLSEDKVAQYEQWNKMLVKWNAKINLVAPSTMDDFWHRHALDSHQLVPLIPARARTILDMGAGAGFPGIAIAIEAMGTGRNITLCETNGKKANFLRAVIRELNLPAEVAQTRIESLPASAQSFDVITARAFTNLTDLLMFSHRFWGLETLGIFPKGENWQSEVDAARTEFQFDLDTHNSRTSEGAKILIISKAAKL